MRRIPGKCFPAALLTLGYSLILALTGCSDTAEDPGCDLFLGSAAVSGVVHDFDGFPVANADVEFMISDTSRCHADSADALRRGQTDVDGYYEVLVQSGNTVGARCVFGRVTGSDSVSTGRVNFTSDCRRTQPIEELELDLVATPSAVIPEDLKITLYREPPFFAGPVYEVSVDASGYVEYEGIQNVAVEGAADTTVELISVARLYRAFENIGYWHIKNIYEPDECDPYVHDSGGASTSLTADGRTHTVIHHHGCLGIAVLDSLTHLECKIDTVLSTTRWVGTWSVPCR